MRRLTTLILGPPLLVGICYWLSMPGAGASPASAPEAPETVARTATADRPGTEARALDGASRRRARALRSRLGPNCRVVVRPPYVLGGDFRKDELARYHRQLVNPIARALRTAYFDTEPNEPVTILLFSGEAAYRAHARSLDGRAAASEYGYYVRSERRAVVNLGTGTGTLAHELTHVLAHFDFPRIPAWFDEGLASLHEQCEFSEDRLRLIGLSNWRLAPLNTALEGERLESIASLTRRSSLGGGRAAVGYAHARYFCLYLQRRHLLGPFYRKFRRNAEHDPTGAKTLRRLLGVETLAEVDRDFRRWVRERRFQRAEAEK